MIKSALQWLLEPGLFKSPTVFIGGALVSLDQAKAAIGLLSAVMTCVIIGIHLYKSIRDIKK